VTPARAGVTISAVGEEDLADLLPLVRGYADFYGVSPADDDLLALSRALIADPAREGVQFLARTHDGAAVGFATVFWLWSTLSARRVGLMNDLFVAPEARGAGAADALIERCRAACREQGAGRLTWQTAKDNARAQAVYDRIGGKREEWLDYWIDA
jgi:GNAT superfamily N-acetyltransferase